MAKRVTPPEEIVEMNRHCNQYGNLAEVGRIIVRSGTTVARYSNSKDTPKIVTHTFMEIIRIVSY